MKKRKRNAILFCSIVAAMVSCGVGYEFFIWEKNSDHGMLWVANATDNTVTCIDRINDKVIGTYPVGAYPSRTAIDLQGNCWVGDRQDDGVWFVTPQG